MPPKKRNISPVRPTSAAKRIKQGGSKSKVAAKPKARRSSSKSKVAAKPKARRSSSKSKVVVKQSKSRSASPTRSHSQSKDSGQHNLVTIYNIYDKSMRFPNWVIEKYNQYATSEAVRNKSRIYGYGKDKALILELATKREPVNIAQHRHYNKKELNQAFGWSRAYYQDYWESKGRLAPNIGIFAPTLVDTGKDALSTKVCLSGYNPILTAKPILMFNAIGLAFDSKEQPDYQYYFAGSLSREKRISEIKRFYKHLFEMIHRCAKDTSAKSIIFSLVGANNFATLYSDEKKGQSGIQLFQKDIWAPAFLDFMSESKPKMKIAFMGAAGSTALKLIQEEHNEIKDTGFFPQNIKNNSNALFVNAWDPLSMPGNGNCGDHSLDGIVGRRSNIAAVAWPLTNPSLKSNITLL